MQQATRRPVGTSGSGASVPGTPSACRQRPRRRSCRHASDLCGSGSTGYAVGQCPPILPAVGATVGRVPVCRRFRSTVTRHVWTETRQKRPCKPSAVRPCPRQSEMRGAILRRPSATIGRTSAICRPVRSGSTGYAVGYIDGRATRPPVGTSGSGAPVGLSALSTVNCAKLSRERAPILSL